MRFHLQSSSEFTLSFDSHSAYNHLTVPHHISFLSFHSLHLPSTLCVSPCSCFFPKKSSPTSHLHSLNFSWFISCFGSYYFLSPLSVSPSPSFFYVFSSWRQECACSLKFKSLLCFCALRYAPFLSSPLRAILRCSALHCTARLPSLHISILSASPCHFLFIHLHFCHTAPCSIAWRNPVHCGVFLRARTELTPATFSEEESHAAGAPGLTLLGFFGSEGAGEERKTGRGRGWRALGEHRLQGGGGGRWLSIEGHALGLVCILSLGVGDPLPFLPP